MPIVSASGNVCKNNYKQKQTKINQIKVEKPKQNQPTNKQKQINMKTKLVFLPLSYFSIHDVVDS